MEETRNQSQGSGFWGGLVGGFLMFAVLSLMTGSGEGDGVLQRKSSGSQTMSAGNASDVSDVVESVNQAVVSIVVSEEVPVAPPNAYQDPFGGFFGGNGILRFQLPQSPSQQSETEVQQVGAGSGFIISEDGYIVTNSHVISQGEQFSAFLSDGTEFRADVVATDPLLDVAVLKIDGHNLPYLEFGDSDQIKLGQTVISIGNALAEFDNTVSVGVISGLSRTITPGNAFGQSETLENVIQTDAAINPGNSGGPLMNLDGQVIGVNVAVVRGSENIGFALPANEVQESVRQMIEHGRVIRPYLGIRYVPITPALQQMNNLPVDYGALITPGDLPGEVAVIPGSPAEELGLRAGDIILEVDGERVDGGHSLSSFIQKKSVGDRIRVKYISGGEERSETVTLRAPEE